MVTDVKAIKTLEEELEELNKGDLPSIFALADQLDDHSTILQALGEFLYSSPLHAFADESLGMEIHVTRDEKADRLRLGIQKLIDLYLAEQNRIIAAHQEQFKKSYYYRLKEFEAVLDSYRTHASASGFRALMEKMADLEKVIEGSDEFRDRALAAKSAACEFRDRALDAARQATDFRSK